MFGGFVPAYTCCTFHRYSIMLNMAWSWYWLLNRFYLFTNNNNVFQAKGKYPGSCTQVHTCDTPTCGVLVQPKHLGNIDFCEKSVSLNFYGQYTFTISSVKPYPTRPSTEQDPCVNKLLVIVSLCSPSSLPRCKLSLHKNYQQNQSILTHNANMHFWILRDNIGVCVCTRACADVSKRELNLHI